MIFYFSGTGNSLWVAEELKRLFNGDLLSITDELNAKNNSFEYTVEPNEEIFFVFPVHSWGPAVLVSRFIEKLIIKGYQSQNIYAICTCGDNCGNTSGILAKALKKRGLHLSKSYSLAMPNNYILMKGFGLDSKELEEQKLHAAPIHLHDIISDIQTKRENVIYEKGKNAWLKSGIVYPMFKTFFLGHNSFYATDSCTSCRLCEEICPTKTISMINDKPEWSNTCVQCCGCIHRCPAQAIEWGKITINQGRYVHPELK
jgi:ferredoxin